MEGVPDAQMGTGEFHGTGMYLPVQIVPMLLLELKVEHAPVVQIELSLQILQGVLLQWAAAM